MFSSLLFALSIGVKPVQAEPMWPDLSIPIDNITMDVSKDSVLIIAIEDYEHISDVPGATVNGRDWEAYFRENGIPTNRIQTLYNGRAYKEDIVEKTKDISQITPDDGRIWFVYIGHGANYNNQPIFLDVNTKASPSYFKHSLTHKEIFDELSKEHDVIAFVDACFSGQDNSGLAFLQGVQFAAPVSLKQMPKVTLLTAGEADQYAGDLPYLGRPGFSYLALGALRGWGDLDGNRYVTLEEVQEYTKQGFQTLSTGRAQTPTIQGMNTNSFIAKAKEKGPNLNELRDKSGISSPTFASSSGVVASKGEFSLEAVRKATLVQEEVEKVRKELDKKEDEIFAKARSEWISEDFVKLRSTRDELSTNMVKAFVQAYEDIQIEYPGKIPFEISEPLKRTISPPEVETAKKWLNGEIKPEVITGKGYKAVLIPAGTFMMGCTEEQGSSCDSDEMPVHQVTITNDFYIMESEVSQHLYEMVMDVGDSSLSPAGVHWSEAVKFVNKLSIMEQLTPCYTIKGRSVIWSKKDCTGWRLATEAEWEYAARGNQNFMYGYDPSLKRPESPQKPKWFSKTQEPNIPYCKDGNPKNGYGLCGVSTQPEWVWDFYDRYTKNDQIDPVGPDRSNCIVGDKSTYYSQHSYGYYKRNDYETIWFGGQFETNDVCRVAKNGRVSNRISEHSLLEEQYCQNTKEYGKYDSCQGEYSYYVNHSDKKVGFRPVRTVK